MKTLQLLLTIDVPDDVTPEQIDVSTLDGGYFVGAFKNSKQIDLDVSDDCSAVPIPYPEPTYILLSTEDVIKINFDEGFNAMHRFLKNENESFELCEFTSFTPVADILSVAEGWYYVILTKKQYQKLQKL